MHLLFLHHGESQNWLANFIDWVSQNQLAALTVALILVTGFYAWTSFRMMRLMHKELAHRVTPIITAELTTELVAPDKTNYTLKVSCSHAAVRIIAARTDIWLQLPAKPACAVDYYVGGHVIAPGNWKSFSTRASVPTWKLTRTEIEYEDLVGLRRERYVLFPKGALPPSEAREQRFWVRLWKLLKFRKEAR